MIPEVFKLTHESETSCHQGYKKTIDRIRQYFYWPGMTAHIKNLVDSCPSCQEKRAHKVNHLAPLQRLPISENPLNRVHCDIIGPLPTTFNGNRYIISYIDAFSKWIEAYPTASVTSDVVADTLADFVARHGIPAVLVTDQGPNLMSAAITKLYQQLGIRHIFTSSYHPAGNGMCEKSHAAVLNALSHIVHKNQTDWDTKLKFALLAIRTARHSSIRYSPAAIVYGRELNLPYNLFAQTQRKSYCDEPSYCELLIPALKTVYSEVKENLKIVAEKQENYRLKTAVRKNIQPGDKVYLFTPSVGIQHTKKLARLNTGPFVVLSKLSDVNFKIAPEKDIAKTQVVHINRLTRAHSRNPELKDDTESDTPSRNYIESELPNKNTPPSPAPVYTRPKRRFLFQRQREVNRETEVGEMISHESATQIPSLITEERDETGLDSGPLKLSVSNCHYNLRSRNRRKE